MSSDRIHKVSIRKPSRKDFCVVSLPDPFSSPPEMQKLASFLISHFLSPSSTEFDQRLHSKPERLLDRYTNIGLETMCYISIGPLTLSHASPISTKYFGSSSFSPTLTFLDKLKCLRLNMFLSSFSKVT